MNSTGTGGKNLQMEFQVATAQRGFETRAVSLSASRQDDRALLSSLAQRKRVPFPAMSSPMEAKPTSRPARNYGGRRFRYRWLDDLKPRQVDLLHKADAMASCLGVPLNTFVTVCYGATFAGEAAMASTFRLGLKRMGQWFRDNGVPFAFVYVHENPGDLKPNSHLLVHVPPRLRRAFAARAGDWFGALDRGVNVQRRNDAHRLAQGLWTRLQYMAKGAPDLTCRLYGGRRARGGQGPIAFKRAGVAQFLSMALKGEFRHQYAHAREETRFLPANSGGEAA